ncbi:uncharacterized protein EDB93DRAFT_1255125 [Suillus bovinus]|uniref:uncharacterized protein n=1 Tax=Suillus bovinus TaxID=48563 RepID=UPI001B8726CA|nr:uncharacterized protein EDB93DRAFT_1255125 [Suillus bovinus]KAG2132708.1 hypothetical protein EDB93DRAFT_1255125 [Suillus bovinus]
MLCWLSLALVLATNVAGITDSPFPESKEPSDVPSQCQARAWARAPDMVPGEIIAGDVKIKLSRTMRGRRDLCVRLALQGKGILEVEASRLVLSEWGAYESSVQDKDLWSIHEEERIAFEIKSPLAGAGRTDPLSRNFTTRFGILVPNTNYPPGLDCRVGFMSNGGETDIISSESIYEYFVEIGFRNGTTSEIPAGITAFTPFHLPTENNAPSVNVSLSAAPVHPGFNMKPSVDMLRSNYTIEVSFPEGAHVYQNSSVKFTAIVHRTGYTNRTDIPVELCASSANGIEWHSQELQNRSQPFPPFIKTLVPSIVPVQHSRSFESQVIMPRPCRELNFAATPAPLAHEDHIISTSSEPLSLSLYVRHDAVPDFSTYYQKLGHRVNLNFHIVPDQSEPDDNEFEKTQREKQIADADELDWVPWTLPTQTRRPFLSGNANVLSHPNAEAGTCAINASPLSV